MVRRTFVLEAELVGFEGVRRTLAARDDATLVDLHYALQSTFGWDDDHLYSFWLDGDFWAPQCSAYLHPAHATSADMHCKSACAPLAELDLERGQDIAYVFDFGNEWRVRLTVADVTAGDLHASVQIVDAAGAAPPQYADVHARYL